MYCRCTPAERTTLLDEAGLIHDQHTVLSAEMLQYEAADFASASQSAWFSRRCMPSGHTSPACSASIQPFLRSSGASLVRSRGSDLRKYRPIRACGESSPAAQRCTSPTVTSPPMTSPTTSRTARHSNCGCSIKGCPVTPQSVCRCPFRSAWPTSHGGRPADVPQREEDKLGQASAACGAGVQQGELVLDGHGEPRIVVGGEEVEQGTPQDGKGQGPAGGTVDPQAAVTTGAPGGPRPRPHGEGR